MISQDKVCAAEVSAGHAYSTTPRRYLVGFAATIALALLGKAGAARTLIAESCDRPNIVLILTDDQGYGDLGCFGSQGIRTPHIDRMARDGVKLTCFYAAAPICTPTRAALMTGCYATRVGLPTPLHVYDREGLSPREVTLPEMLQKRGYRTACIGKWHLGHTPEHFPTRHGFDHYYGTPLGHMFDRPSVGKAVGDTSGLFLIDERAIPFPAHESLTERLTEAAVEFINKNKDRPFFLYVAHTMPHEPLAVSQRFAGRSDGGLYGDVIECIDWSTGQLLSALESNKLLEKTIVVMTSDNGPKRGHGSAGELRGFKHEPYEGGVRVPCVVYAPGRLPSGRTVGAIATIMDWYPTFARLSGADAPQGQARDGRDIWPMLSGEQQSLSDRDEFFYFVRHGVLAGVRQGRWKLIRYKGRLELFDLAADLSEASNVASENPSVVARLDQRMREFDAEVASDRRRRETGAVARD